MKYEGAITYSRLHDFETCELQFQLRHIEKRSEPSSTYFEKGNRVHQGIEQFLKMRTKNMPEEAEKLAMKISWLRKQPNLRGEEAWAFDRDWKPLPVTGYFGKQDHIRAKLDALLIKGASATVIDFKTGQVRETNVDQVRWYGVLTMLREKLVKTAGLEVWYVEHGKIDTFKTIARNELDMLLDHFKKRIAKMMSATKFKPTPGLQCRWCPFSKHKGGPCQY